MYRDPSDPLTAEEFTPKSIDLEIAYPLAYDATTSSGLSALMDALPQTWPEALAFGRSTHPAPTAASWLDELFQRGSTRALALDAWGDHLLRTRRSALAQLDDHLPRVRLRDIDEDKLDLLVRSYRHGRTDLSSPMISLHITELRFLIAEAREEAGMRPLGPPPAPPTRRQGRRVARPMAAMDAVVGLLQRGRREIQLMIALILCSAALPGRLLALRARDVDLDGALLTIDTRRTRGRDHAPGHMVYGLPRWCVASIRSCCPGIDGWPPDRPLFPAPQAWARPRKEMTHLWRSAADDKGYQGMTMQDVRRLAQAIHGGAPRAVRRTTATARLDVEVSLDSAEALRLAEAQASYAERMVREWIYVDRPPIRPKRTPPRRARRDTLPEAPERRTARPPMRAKSVLLPEGIFGPPGREGAPASRPTAAKPLAEPKRTRGTGWTSAPDQRQLPPSPDVPTGFGRSTLPSSQVASPAVWHAVRDAEQRAVGAEQREAQLRATTITHDEAYASLLAVGMTGVTAGMALENYLTTHPTALADMTKQVGAVAHNLLQALAPELAPAPSAARVAPTGMGR